MEINKQKSQNSRPEYLFGFHENSSFLRNNLLKKYQNIPSLRIYLGNNSQKPSHIYEIFVSDELQI